MRRLHENSHWLSRYLGCFSNQSVVLLLLVSAASWAHRSSENTRLLVAEPAPEFSLLDQNGAPFTLTGLRGKVVVVTFIYTKCNGACPVLTEKMASLQAMLGPDFDSRVHFVSITSQGKQTPASLDCGRGNCSMLLWLRTGREPALKQWRLNCSARSARRSAHGARTRPESPLRAYEVCHCVLNVAGCLINQGGGVP